MKLSKKQKPPRFKRKEYLFAIILIAVAGIIVYANTLGNEFVWDDEYLIEKNLYLKHPIHLSQIFAENLFAGAQKEFNCYRPLQCITYIFDYRFSKLNPRGYHITNILLHILTALSLYCLTNLLFSNKLLSLFSSLFFITNPIHTGAVTYISGRADPLMALFFLTSLILYIKYLSVRKIYLYILFLLSYILSLLSKEIALILPLLLLLYHYTFSKRIKFSDHIFPLSITFGYILLRLTVLNFSLANPVQVTTIFQRLPGLFVAITNYLRLLILPLNLHIEYGFPLFRFNNPKAIIGMIILTLLFISLLQARKLRNHPPPSSPSPGWRELVFFSIGWFLLTLIPVSNLYPLNAYMAEHWLYLPSIGFFLLLSRLLVPADKRLSPVAMTIFVMLIGFYSSMTIKQNHYWRTPLAFYERTLKFAPGSDRIHNNLGLIYKDKNLYDKAIAEYAKAIEINPNNAKAYSNLAIAYNEKRMYQEAIASARKAIEIDSDCFEAYNNLGVVYQAKRMYHEAIIQYKKAIEINPSHPEIHNNLGKAYYTLQLYDKAILEYKKTIEINPDYREAYNNLAVAYGAQGLLYYAQGLYKEAITQYQKAIEINPNYAEAYNNLAVAYGAQGKHNEAINYGKKAIEINPNYAEAYNNLAVAYYYNKQYELAVKYYDRARVLGDRPQPDLERILEAYR